MTCYTNTHSEHVPDTIIYNSNGATSSMLQLTSLKRNKGGVAHLLWPGWAVVRSSLTGRGHLCKRTGRAMLACYYLPVKYSMTAAR